MCKFLADLVIVCGREVNFLSSEILMEHFQGDSKGSYWRGGGLFSAPSSHEGTSSIPETERKRDPFSSSTLDSHLSGEFEDSDDQASCSTVIVSICRSKTAHKIVSKAVMPKQRARERAGGGGGRGGETHSAPPSPVIGTVRSKGAISSWSLIPVGSQHALICTFQ